MNTAPNPGTSTAPEPASALPITLSAEQQRVAQRLLSRTHQHLDALAQISDQRLRRPAGGTGVHAPAPGIVDLKTPRQSNCVGVFGRRGSGKTTVMVSMLRQLHASSCGWRAIQQPLDLSYAPHEFPHGLTVVHWLYEVLRQNPEGRSGDATVRKTFDKTSQSFFRGSDGFNRLVRDLAVSAEHYASAAAKEISLRLSLRQDIQCWLDAQAQALGVQGFVIAIDDMDLTPANRHQSLIWSLLDELHQDRLFFVLGADLERLEQRLAEEDQFARHGANAAANGDAASHRQAAADLAYKVLPQVDRAELRPWPRAERGAFPPSASPQTPTIQQLADALALRPIVRQHLGALLPEWARGLENVYRELRQLQRDRTQRGSDPSPSDAARAERELMGSLAESRFDFDLARKLRERELPDWATTFQWLNPSVTVPATWAVLRKRLDENEDLPELLPDPATCPLRIALERARWAEVLLDVALTAQRLAPARLAHRIPWLQARLGECEVALQRPQDSVDRALEDDPGGMLAALYWLRWSDVTGNRRGWFALGLWPLLQWMAGDRELWPAALSGEVWTPTSLAREARTALAPDAPQRDSVVERLDTLARGQSDATDEAVLPLRVRDLLRVADALARQPWISLRDAEVRIGPPGLARLAAALSYHTLRSMIADLPDAAALNALVAPLRAGTGGVGALDEVGIREGFAAVDRAAAADREALRTLDAPLAVALRALLEAPWFRGLAV